MLGRGLVPGHFRSFPGKKKKYETVSDQNNTTQVTITNQIISPFGQNFYSTGQYLSNEPKYVKIGSLGTGDLYFIFI
jgi:hypothetical protein